MEFDPTGFEDLAWWIEMDRKKAKKIIKLIKEIQRHPFEGTGKPEPLKHELTGCWSRHIGSGTPARLSSQERYNQNINLPLSLLSFKGHYVASLVMLRVFLKISIIRRNLLLYKEI